MAITPETPKGFRDLDPNKAYSREKIIQLLQRKFKQFGFMPLETPSVEKIQILKAKGGNDEAVNQIFTVANIDYKLQKECSNEHGESGYLVQPSLGLRFDLTVPLSRYVASHKFELSFPFKRYQIGNVWRGEKPKEGRYREFLQCDVDVISNKPLTPYHDGEVIACAYACICNLGIKKFTFYINNRRALVGYIQSIINDPEVSVEGVLRILDKRDKYTDQEICEMFSSTYAIQHHDSNRLLEVLDNGYAKGISSEIDAALIELSVCLETAISLGVPKNHIKIQPSLARGLGYYTGNVVETFAEGFESFGSICSGGRYDSLCENYGISGFPGTGISIGISRIQTILEEMKSDTLTEPVIDAYIGLLNPEFSERIFKLLNDIRDNGLSVECDISENRIKSIISRATRLNAKYLIVIGNKEIEEKKISLKNLSTHETQKVAFNNVIEVLKHGTSCQ